MFYVTVNETSVAIHNDNRDDQMLDAVNIYHYFNRTKVKTVMGFLEFHLNPGVYMLEIIRNNPHNKSVCELVCVGNTCFLCGRIGAMASLKGHHNIFVHNDCFFRNKQHLFFFCQHELGCHILETDIINEQIDLSLVMRFFDDRLLDTYNCLPFHIDIIDVSYCKNCLKIFKKNAVQIDENALIIRFKEYMRLYNPQMRLLRDQNLRTKNFHIINYSRLPYNEVLHQDAISLYCVFQHKAIQHEVYIYFTKDSFDIPKKIIDVHSDVVIVL